MSAAGGFESFPKSMSAAVPLVDPESIDALGTTLANQVAILQVAGHLVAVNYRHVYETQEDGWARLVLFTESLYQQLHAVATTAAVLVAQSASPKLGKVGSFHQLRSVLGKNPSHPLAARARARRRELDVLWWWCEVRNVALQHRAERAYTGNRGIVMLDGFALLRTAEPIPPATLRKASTLFVGLSRRYGDWNETPGSSREALTYLDLASYELLAVASADFDTCRKLVIGAACCDLVVSLPAIEAVDAGLSALIELALP